jgi:tellurite resistance protein TerC
MGCGGTGQVMVVRAPSFPYHGPGFTPGERGKPAVSSTALLTIFFAVVGVLLVLDLFVAHRGEEQVSVRSAVIWSAIWIVAGLAFGAATMPAFGGADALATWYSVYLIEKSLSIDNVFLWLVVFSTLQVPHHLQRRVLLYGVLGAFAMRSGVIYVGAALVERFAWVMLVAGAFLIFAGYKLWRDRDKPEEHELKDPLILRMIRSVIPTTDGYRGDRFIVREGGRWLATPMLTALILVELTDVVLALDALPAALHITTQWEIIVTANLFGLLGLRSLYFLLAGVAARLHYLQAAVAVILIYIGGTMLLESVIDGYHLSTMQSLGVITFILSAAIWASLRRNRLEQETGLEDPAPADEVTANEEADR